MLSKKIKYILFISILTVSGISEIYCQDWNTINDSTYNSIVKNRFAKSNILIGFGGIVKTDYSDYKTFESGIRSQIGYFVANQWLLSGYYNAYYVIVKQDSIGKIANYISFNAGPTLRYYLKPKARTIFCQLSANAGLENQKSDDISEFANFYSTMIGGSIAIGLSAFIRRFELELLVGIKINSSSYTNAVSFGLLTQINFSYILDKNKIRKP